MLSPLSLTKRPQSYADRLLAAPVAGQRAACAALATAVLRRPRVRGSVVAAFTVQSLYSANAGLGTVRALLGPFDDVKAESLPTRYTDTAVETVSLKDADVLSQRLVAWMEGK